MPVGTTDIAITDVTTEMNKSTTITSLKQCVNAAVESSTDLGGQASQSSLGAFAGYTHKDTTPNSYCVFKFDPHLPSESGVIYDPYDDTQSKLPLENNDSNVYTTGINQATFTQGTGVDAGGAGYIDIRQTSANYAGIKYTNVTVGESYKPTSVSFTVAFWLYIDSIPSGVARIMSSDGTDSGSSPYNGWTILINSSNAVVLLIGDGGGTASSNRRSIISSAFPTSRWFFVEIDVINATTTPTGTIRATAATATNRNTASKVASTSGSGGAMSYSTTKPLYIGNNGANTATNVTAKIGHVWVFNSVVETTSALMENIFDSTKTQYT